MKHLVFVTLSLTRGGAERVISNMCNEYFADRCKVTVISLMKAEPEYELRGEIRFLTIDQCYENYRRSMPVRFLTRRRKLTAVLQSIIAQEGAPDCIVSFLPEPNMLMCSLRRKLGIPLIISVRNDPQVEYRSRLKYGMMKLLYPKSDGYVFQTEQAKSYFSFSKHISEISVVIPNPVSKEFLTPETSKQTVSESEVSKQTASEQAGSESELSPEKRARDIYQVVAFGRLERQKNYELMLRAFDEFHQHHQGSRLTIYGEGSERKHLETFVKEHQLETAVSLPGNTAQVRERLAEADLFLMTSDYEGMPNSLMEAMVSGLPVISTNCPCGGPAYLIEEGINGILIPMPQEWTAAPESLTPQEQQLHYLTDRMEYLYLHPDSARRMGAAAARIVEKVSPEAIYRKWNEYMEFITEL